MEGFVESGKRCFKVIWNIRCLPRRRLVHLDNKEVITRISNPHSNGPFLLKTGFTVAPSTLGRWVARLDTIGNVISQNKESGNEPALSREQRDIASGMVLHENANGNIVSLDSFKCFVQEYFDLIISYSTISRYLDEDGFACRLIQKKGKSFVVDVEALRDALWNWVWIKDFRCRGIKKENYASIDFTFTSHRNHRRTSFAPRGGPQPMAADDAPLFTNCIVTCAWDDGLNRTPPMLFTYNSAFRKDRNPTKNRLEKVAHLEACLDKYGISEDRIIYIGNEKKEMRKYARECPDLIRLFFQNYEVPSKSIVYSDQGNSFFDNGESVLLEAGFIKHCCYPSIVHQYLSVNDNALHGTSKQSWRTCGVKFSDDVESCICLLSFLDRDLIKYSQYWWDRNMISITEEGVKELIKVGPCKLSHLHKSWKRSYEEFMNENEDNNK